MANLLESTGDECSFQLISKVTTHHCAKQKHHLSNTNRKDKTAQQVNMQNSSKAVSAGIYEFVCQICMMAIL